MINQNELRVGNWMLSHTYSLFYQIKKGCDIEYYAQKFSPIPLTPEVLEQCGFSFHRASGLWYISHQTDEKEASIILDKDFNVLDNALNPVGIQLHYLHQLQNVYADFTEKELSLKLFVSYDD